MATCEFDLEVEITPECELAIEMQDTGMEIEVSIDSLLPMPSATYTTYTASGNISSFNLVMATGANTVAKNDPTDTANYDLCVGVAKTSALTGETVQVVTSGEVDQAGWGLTPAAIYFAGPNGTITTSPPVSGLLQRVGVAKDPDTLILDLDDPIEL